MSGQVRNRNRNRHKTGITMLRELGLTESNDSLSLVVVNPEPVTCQAKWFWPGLCFQLATGYRLDLDALLEAYRRLEEATLGALFA